MEKRILEFKDTDEVKNVVMAFLKLLKEQEANSSSSVIYKKECIHLPPETKIHLIEFLEEMVSLQSTLAGLIAHAHSAIEEYVKRPEPTETIMPFMRGCLREIDNFFADKK